MSTSPPTLFLSGEIFQLLVDRVPKELLNGLEIPAFDEAVGTSKERFRFIVDSLAAEGRTQGFVGHETAAYLRNALSLTVLQLDTEFETRTGFSKDEAIAILQALAQQTTPVEVA